MTPEEFVAVFEEDGDRASVDALSWVGGVSVVEPGATGNASVELEAGDYLMVCYVPDADGTSHVMLGMVAALHVEGQAVRSPSGTTPVATETVVLRDYRIEVPSGFRGSGEVAFRNEGGEPHEVVLLRLAEGRTLADVAAYEPGRGGDPPYTFAGGVASIAPGVSSTAELDLVPGDYIATCFVPARDGTPHVDLGMLAAFTVG